MSLCSTVNFKIKYFKPVAVHLEVSISSVPVEFGCDTKMLLSVLLMEIPVFNVSAFVTRSLLGLWLNSGIDIWSSQCGLLSSF